MALLTSITLPFAISAMTFVVFVLLFVGIYVYYGQYGTRQKMIEKVRGAAEIGGAAGASGVSVKSAAMQQPDKTSQVLGFVGKHVVDESSPEYTRLRKNLISAGIRKPNAPAIFWGAKCLLVILLPSVFMAIGLTILTSFNPRMYLGFSLFLALAGFYLPDYLLFKRKESRKQVFRDGLPDALDLLIVCVEAGMGLDSAIHRVAEEMALSNKVLSDEFKVYGLEVKAGKRREEAMKDLAARIDLEDMYNLTSLLVQTDKFGTSLSQALRVYSDTFRTKRFMRAEEKAARLPGLMLFPLIIFIFPALFVALLGPAAIEIYRTMFLEL